VGGDDVVRNHLASYLHDHHPRTAYPDKADTAGLKPVNVGSWTLRRQLRSNDAASGFREIKESKTEQN
jgi:hypothetical protein